MANSVPVGSLPLAGCEDLPRGDQPDAQMLLINRDVKERLFPQQDEVISQPRHDDAERIRPACDAAARR